MRILLTGGAGFIGSHTALALVKAGHQAIIIDNLSNSSRESIRRISKMTGVEIPFIKADIRNAAELRKIFIEYKPDAVIHFAALKSPAQSQLFPLEYYDNNISGSLVLYSVMQELGVKKLVFSSSATVYGVNLQVPLQETEDMSPINPYGRTKMINEYMLADIFAQDNDWDISILRYFNPVGADVSGIIGEDPRGIPNNLFPFISQVAIGKREILSVFGHDYATPDGTCLRDYIHVTDVALGHLAALEKLRGLNIYNLGTGEGYSVLDIVRAFESVIGREIPRQMAARRPGDIAISCADVTKVHAELGWQAGKTLADMCADSWRWQTKNPHGYNQ